MYIFLYNFIIFNGDKMIINYLKSLLWSFIILLGSSLIITIFNYFNVISGIPLKIIFLIIPIISIFIGSYRLGKLSNEKGYVEGIKYGLIWIVLFIIISIICKVFDWTSVIYYIILLFISILGSILGINRKKK